VITETALVDRRARRVLVFAPAPIVERDVWGREARAWEHLQGVSVVPLTGTAKRRLDRLRAPTPGAPRLDVISYENAVWLTDQVDLNIYDAVVFDELSKIKAPGTQRFKRLRYRCMQIPVRVGLTGSPIGNRLLDLWGEMFMVTGPLALGPTMTGFKEEYFHPEGYGVASSWALNCAADRDRIFERVKPYAFSLDAAKLLAGTMPELHVHVRELELPREVQENQDELFQACATLLTDGTKLRALNASAKAGKARQLASGAVYTEQFVADAELDETKPWSEVHDVKIAEVRALVEEAQGEPILLFYWYQHELARLQKAFPEARLATDQDALDAWDRREVPLLLAHPMSAGHGLNLQHGGCTIVWMTLPYSHELWEQGNGRELRIGQLSPFVTALVLCCGDFDRAVLSLLREKGETQDALMRCVDLDLEDPALT
jgi:hypothetical protein